MIENEPLRLYDLHVHILVLVIDAVGPVHDEPPDAAQLHVHLVNRCRETSRSPPIHDVLRIGPHLEDQLARCIKNAGREDFPIGCACDGHASSPPSSSTRAGSRPVDRNSAPRSGGTAPPSPPLPLGAQPPAGTASIVLVAH